MKKNIFYIILQLLFVLPFLGKAQNNLTLEFNHLVGNKMLVLFDTTYHNSLNEPFVVNKFKYYVSNIVVYNKGKKVENNGYYLINTENSNSQTIQLKTATKNIDSIAFTIGIDSAKNAEGIQTGALDPMNGMYWTWNSGYIFAKLEGQSDSSKAASNYFNYHIGGYKHFENAIQTIHLKVVKSQEIIHKIMIDVDVLKWFNGKHSIAINKIANCVQPGDLAKQIAENYATMFSIKAVQ
jgi:hypothetical protein